MSGPAPLIFSVDPRGRDWEPFRVGVEVSWLYRNGEHGPAAAYLRYSPGARIPAHAHAGYEHVLVLEGAQSDRNGRHGRGTLAINLPGSSHDVVAGDEGCLVLIIWERPPIFAPPDPSIAQ